MSDLEARQHDEVESLRSIYGDIFTDVTPQETVWSKKASPHFQIALRSHENPQRPEVSLVLDIAFTPTYPSSPPIVQVLSPQNLLRARLAQIEAKIAALLKEYAGEELCFTVVMDVKEMLDDFQQTTEQVVSLEEERERRLANERRVLEATEKEALREAASAKEKLSQAASAELRQMRNDYPGETENDLASTSASDQYLPGSSVGPTFVFDNVLYGESGGSRFRFRAVQGFIPSHTRGLLSDVGEQYTVTPYVQSHRPDAAYLLTVVELEHEFWQTAEGRAQIRQLELELEQAMTLHAVRGFQIDRTEDEKGKQDRHEPKSKTKPSWSASSRQSEISGSARWTVRILTDPEPSTLADVLPAAGSIHWALARTWLIQLLPALEALHDAGVAHQLLCPASVVLTDGTLRLCHPSYGASLLRMAHVGQSDHYLDRYIPRGWRDPDSSGGPAKSDVWQLGVLFLRVMLGYGACETEFRTPQQFLSGFRPEKYPVAEHAERVYDLLSRMLQPRASKRPSLVELNALKFFRSGMEEPPQRDPIGSSRYQTSMLNAARGATSVSRRRLSNRAASPFVETESRYEREFEEVGKLGKGGFGEVVKARNRMEGTFYAIKKIKHRADKLETLLSEVLSLARLNHQYIVRYYGCWVEEARGVEPTREEEDTSDSDDEFESPLNMRSSSFLASRDNSFQIDYFSNSMDPSLGYADSLDDRIVFATSDDSTERQDSDDEQSDSSGSHETDDDEALVSSESESESESESAISARSLSKSFAKSHSSGSSSRRHLGSARSTLYIQMEFCENNTLLDLIEKGLPNNPSEYWRLFRQILEAVSYIHSSGFIHRDLKPTNIFIDRSNNIKVGDFGLAKNSHFSSALSKNNQVASPNKDLSTLVGTFFYTAKEVATGEYDEKVDMYSLGIIFFEMCHQMSTGMERAMILNDLRLAEVKFPSDFDSRKLTERKIIQQLLAHDPKSRPGATELLQSGAIPVEHQDIIIKEALKSLADPASPWQQHVRDALFKQPYSLARDLMFDNAGTSSHSGIIEHTTGDYLILSQTLNELSRLFETHGAIQDFDGSALIPKSSTQSKEQVYEILDRNGSVLTLSYDLVLPMARFLSRNYTEVSKLHRHEFVYRPNLRGIGRPDKYSAVAFDIFSHSTHFLKSHDAECIKVVDEILCTFPCFKAKNAQAFIIVNHSDILNSAIDFAFGSSNTLSQSRRYELMGVLSQLGVERGSEDIKRYLRDEFKIQHTVVKDLIDLFNFTVEPERARLKLRKIMVDSPLLAKVERALNELQEILDVLQSLGVSSTVSFCPLSNYNAKYYDGAFMFQAIYRIDKNRKFSRFVTGGRYDRLIDSLSNDGLTKSRTPHGVGFQLTSTLLFLLMKNAAKRSQLTLANSKTMGKWRKSRCDVLVTSSQESIIKDSGFKVLKELWAHGISSDWFFAKSNEELNNRAIEDGCDWIVQLKQKNTGSGRRSKKSSFKPIRVKSIEANKDTDLDYDELLHFLLNEIEERNAEANEGSSYIDRKEDLSQTNDDSRIGEPLFNLDIDQRVIVVSNSAPRGRKNNKKEKWELENDSKLAGADLMKSLAKAPIVIVDSNDSTLDMISSMSLNTSQEEWHKKLFFTDNKLPRSYAAAIYETLNKEAARGVRWALLHSPKTDKTTIVDLQR
ncbi:putative serine/threonine-protein kinase [Clavispora lusitaniae]|uniref:non-specific serine/threonine protein kinase n=1 Tax=Clavispora lusitaniae TaxID=36911 RepID=A0AA91Q151_CLALS|nr:putative serine/threonine-protein kinase [Clavispora lusitaniae]